MFETRETQFHQYTGDCHFYHFLIPEGGHYTWEEIFIEPFIYNVSLYTAIHIHSHRHSRQAGAASVSIVEGKNNSSSDV